MLHLIIRHGSGLLADDAEGQRGPVVGWNTRPGPALGSFLCRDFHAGSVNRLPCPAFCGVAGVPLRPIEGLWNENTPLRTLPLPLVAPEYAAAREGEESRMGCFVSRGILDRSGRGSVGLSVMKDARSPTSGATRENA